jgi:polar amino acid transport system substrate-binding protein
MVTVLGDSFPPFSYSDNGKNKGMVYEIVNEVMKDSGVKVKKHIISSWKTVLDYTKKNPNTLLYTIVRTPKREKQFHWIGSISDRRMYFYVLKSREDIKINSWKDISKYRTLSLDKATITEFVKARGAKVYGTRDLKQAYDMLLKKRADLMVMLDYSFNYIDGNKKSARPVWKIDQPGEYYLAMNINTPKHIVDKIRKSFKKLKDNGTIKRMKAGY